MITIPLHNRIDFIIDEHVYRRPGLQHGPHVWPWWQLFSITVVRWSGTTPSAGWNIWIYTRWNAAWCTGVHFTGRSAV